jgi:hypothetical protein
MACWRTTDSNESTNPNGVNWDSQATTTFGIDQVPVNLQATRLGFASGLTTRIDNHLSVYGQAGYQFGVSETTENVRRNAVQG